MVKTGLAVGLNKGHVVTVRTPKPRASSRKGVSSSHDEGVHLDFNRANAASFFDRGR